MRIAEDAFAEVADAADFPCRTLMRLPIGVLAQGLDTLPMVAGLTGPDRNLLVANRAYYEYFGPDHSVTFEERRCAVYADDISEYDAFWAQALRNGRLVEGELRLLRNLVEPRWHRLRVTPLLAGRDRLLGVFFVAMDIEDKVRGRGAPEGAR
jgi:PAS domain-containing protein